MTNSDYEPRGCPTPGACSASVIIERQREALRLAEGALAVRTSLRDNEQARCQKALDAVRSAISDFIPGVPPKHV